MEKILAVDDEESIIEVLEINLKRAGYEVVTARTGREAIDAFRDNIIHLVLLDLQLPDMDGFQVAQEIKKKASPPIIFVTARGDDVDRILGLERGADDYIVKPFNPREVVARVTAVLRRLVGDPSTGKVVAKSLTMDLLKRKAMLRDDVLELSPKEFDLLSYFAANPRKILTRDDILKNVWGTEHIDTRTVDVHVKNLRDKLKDETLLKTIWGKGYQFNITF